jgi:hypothetical protein
MIAFKFRIIRGQKYIDVRLYASEINKTPQMAGSIKLDPYEWSILRGVLEAGQDASNDDVLLHFEEVV